MYIDILTLTHILRLGSATCAVDRDCGARVGGRGFSSPSNFGKTFVSIEKLLFYCFHRYAIINEDFRQ